jgi:protein SCO1/2
MSFHTGFESAAVPLDIPGEGRNRFMKCKAQLLARVAGATVSLLLLASPGAATQSYAGSGLVLKVVPERSEIVMSMQEISGFMEAMVMPLQVRQRRDLDGLRPGMMVDFALIVTKDSSFAENLRVHSFSSVEPDPQGARQLATVEKELSNTSSEPELAPGQHVPDFSLTDQNRQQVTLSQFQGKIVAMTFVYTGCSLPNFCFRLSNNFSQLEKRFRKQMGSDLILLTVTLDPTNDQPDVLAKYAGIWRAEDGASWHFLTGPPPSIKRVTGLFGVVYKPGEGAIIHSLHTVIIDRQGNLVTNLEGTSSPRSNWAIWWRLR